MVKEEKGRKTLLLSLPPHSRWIGVDLQQGAVRLEAGGVAFRADLVTLGHKEHCLGPWSNRAESHSHHFCMGPGTALAP